jgi:prepilin-type N-terminal cleavage/methylation domain-containing protein
MLKNLLNKKRQEGFSIVEVMIVLAIAGLIILVVFLAVPALQRNSRNTTARNDASAISGALGEYRSAKNGANPATGTVTVTNGAATIDSVAAIQVNNLTAINIIAATTSAQTPSLDTAIVVLGKKCGSGGNGAAWTPANGASRSAAVIFAVETSGGTIANCIDA